MLYVHSTYVYNITHLINETVFYYMLFSVAEEDTIDFLNCGFRFFNANNVANQNVRDEPNCSNKRKLRHNSKERVTIASEWWEDFNYKIRSCSSYY